MSKSECQRQSNWKVKFKKVTYLKPSDKKEKMTYDCTFVM